MRSFYMLVLFCIPVAAPHRNGSLPKNSGYNELMELERQNRITQQIFANFVERRLFPFRRPQQKVPTIDDILPTSTESPRKFKPKSNRRGHSKQHKREQEEDQKPEEDVQRPDENPEALDDFFEKDSEPESLQSVESSHHDQYYRDDYADVAENEVETATVGPAQNLALNLHLYYQYLNSMRNEEPSNETIMSNTTETGTEIVPITLTRKHSKELEKYLRDCPNCVDETQFANKWTMPLLKLGEKRYYLGIFFKANWFKAAQYCRFHGMHLASISSQEENDRLEKHIRDFGLGHEHFWISGTDLADEGNFFWMANGRPITFTNWNAGEPNNFRYENGEEENCLELWNRDGKGLKWNDSPCSFETYFVCEVQ